MSSPSPERQVAFLTNVQRLLAEGSFVATYKYALLLALADICVERGADDDEPLEIPTRLIAEQFIAYYWRQSAPYTPELGDKPLGVLRQNTATQASVIRVLHDARARYEGSLAAARRDAHSWRPLVASVDKSIRKMPLWKLQTVGPGEHLDFLYDNLHKGTRITLKPGVAFCFRKHYGLIADLVRGAWTRHIRRFNTDLLGARADLDEFLFGSERADLSPVRPVLMEHQHGACFYCRRPIPALADGHVDHFIPWSRYPVDLGHNFVLAHNVCNERKTDWLPATQHLRSWAEQTAMVGAQLAGELTGLGVISDHRTSARIALWAYGQTFECRGLTWLRGRELERLEPGWDISLATLLN